MQENGKKKKNRLFLVMKAFPLAKKSSVNKNPLLRERLYTIPPIAVKNGGKRKQREVKRASFKKLRLPRPRPSKEGLKLTRPSNWPNSQNAWESKPMR